MCSDEFIAEAMELIAALGGLCQLHCENGDVLYLPRGQGASPQGA